MRRRVNSYRDPDLSDQWLREAEWKARHRFGGDAAKIVLRLVAEVRKVNKEAGR